MHLTLIENFLVDDGDARNGKVAGRIFHFDFAENKLRRRCSDVNADAEQIRHEKASKKHEKLR